MSYPAPPWTLKGYALQTVNLIDIERVRPLIPPELSIISVLPGKTLGGIYISNYGPGSILEYSELIVVAGLASHAGKMGPWISHIYVDNPDSVAGGREIWGLPKELAEFVWNRGSSSSVSVHQGNQPLCSIQFEQSFSLWQQPLAGTSFSHLNTELLLFKADATLRPGFVSAKLTVPHASPFSSLSLQQPWLTVHAENMQLTVHKPDVVGQTQFDRPSYRSPVYQ